MLVTVQDAYDLLADLGAPDRLLTHVKLVGEAAEDIIAKLQDLGLEFDSDLARLGVAVHDAGKIVYLNELSGPGNNHEPAGQKLLLEHGVQENIARCCLSHARYHEMDVSLEELLVALSDKLWKGKRVTELEETVIELVAGALGKDKWDIFPDLDMCFETIAAQGDNRLNRSR